MSLSWTGVLAVQARESSMSSMQSPPSLLRSCQYNTQNTQVTHSTEHSSEDSSVHNIKTCLFARAAAARQRNSTDLNILGQSSQTLLGGEEGKITTVFDFKICFQLPQNEILKCFR